MTRTFPNRLAALAFATAAMLAAWLPTVTVPYTPTAAATPVVVALA